LFNITTTDKLDQYCDWRLIVTYGCADTAYGVCVGTVRIFSASTSAFYHFEDPDIHIWAHPHFTRGHVSTMMFFCIYCCSFLCCLCCSSLFLVCFYCVLLFCIFYGV